MDLKVETIERWMANGRAGVELSILMGEMSVAEIVPQRVNDPAERYQAIVDGLNPLS